LLPQLNKKDSSWNIAISMAAIDINYKESEENRW